MQGEVDRAGTLLDQRTFNEQDITNRMQVWRSHSGASTARSTVLGTRDNAFA